MSAKGRILAELGDIAFRWVSSLADKLGKPADEVAEEMGTKLSNLEIEMPEAFGLFEQNELYSILKDANRGDSDVAIMNPEDFRKVAAQINTSDPAIAKQVSDTVAEYMDDVQQGTAIGRVPYLEFETPYTDDIAQFVMHDGRHRNRAMANLGALRNLVRVIPKKEAKLASDLPESAKAYTEQSSLQIPGEGGKEVGNMRDLFKYLSVMGVPLGALGGITDDEQNGI
jgi:hypothetical protein